MFNLNPFAYLNFEVQFFSHNMLIKENEYLFSKHFENIFTNLNILSKYLNRL